MLTSEQRHLVHRSMQRLVLPCMKAQGFLFGLPDQTEPPPGGHRPDFLDRRYDAVYDEATARKYGYHSPLSVDVPTAPPDDPAYTAAAVAALYGTDEERTTGGANVEAGRTKYGGCMGAAEKQLAAGMSLVSPGAYWSQPVRLLNLDNTPDNDPRLTSAQSEWSACMAERGYPITNTVTDDWMPFDLTTRYPSKAEIAAALWDVKCQQRTKVVQVWFDVESAYQRKKIDEQAELFARIRKENERLVERAATVLGEDVP